MQDQMPDTTDKEEKLIEEITRKTGELKSLLAKLKRLNYARWYMFTANIKVPHLKRDKKAA